MFSSLLKIIIFDNTVLSIDGGKRQRMYSAQILNYSKQWDPVTNEMSVHALGITCKELQFDINLCVWISRLFLLPIFCSIKICLFFNNYRFATLCIWPNWRHKVRDMCLYISSLWAHSQTDFVREIVWLI